MTVELFYEQVFKVIELQGNENHFEKQVQSFKKTAYIADPVKYAVYVSINPVECQIELKGDLQVNAIGPLVRPGQLEAIGENLMLFFCQITELVVSVL